MEGQAVSIGSSISQTGSLLVYCNKPYVLRVDNVEWSPIGERDGADEYVVASAGFFEVLVDGVRVFFFRNVIAQDFTHATNNVRLYLNNSIVKTFTGDASYGQGQFVGCDEVRVTMTGFNKTPEEVVALGATSSTGSVTISTSQDRVSVVVTGMDVNQYLQIKVGNVLLAFLLPM